ncbi:50S ribosomal protein L33 [Glycine max]|nr:50S ribosomal protein L33 [Glycine max]
MGDKKKKAQMFVKLVSAAGTGFFYVKRKPRQFTEKLEFRKYDPRVNRHIAVHSIPFLVVNCSEGIA